MTPRSKFILLLDSSGTLFLISLLLFLSSDYARREYAYFTSYPYRDGAARHKTDTQVLATLTPFVVREITPPAPEIARLPEIRHTVPLAFAEDYDQRLTSGHAALVHAAPPAPSRTKPAAPITPSTPSPAQLGYLAYAREDYDQAVSYFAEALRQAPDSRQLILQSAYAQKKLGRNADAIRAFRRAIDLSDGAAASFAHRREVEQLENRFAIDGYWIYRAESSRPPENIGADLTQSQSGFELSYQPPGAGHRDGRTLQLYGRLLAGMPPNSTRLDDRSYQAGIGMRSKPLSRHNLVLSIERLIKVGAFARHDWMLRAGYSRDQGTDYRADVAHWPSYSLYLDVALIRPHDPDIFLTAQATGGYNFRLVPGVILQPHLLTLASWQRAATRKASLIEAGPGVSLRIYFNDTLYEAYRSYVTLTAEYRMQIAGNSNDDSGPVIGATVHF